MTTPLLRRLSLSILASCAAFFLLTIASSSPASAQAAPTCSVTVSGQNFTLTGNSPTPALAVYRNGRRSTQFPNPSSTFSYGGEAQSGVTVHYSVVNLQNGENGPEIGPRIYCGSVTGGVFTPTCQVNLEGNPKTTAKVIRLTGNAPQYAVYSNGSRVGAISSVNTVFRKTGLTPGKTFHFSLRNIINGQETGPRGYCGSVKPASVQVQAPRDCGVSSTTNNIGIFWKGDVTRYAIYRNGVRIKTVEGSVGFNRYTDWNAKKFGNNHYSVVNLVNGQEAGRTYCGFDRLYTCSVNANSGSNTVSWANSGAYILYRNGVAIESTVSLPRSPYVDTNVQAGKTYHYTLYEVTNPYRIYCGSVVAR